MNKDVKVMLIFLTIASIVLLYTTIVLFVLKESEHDRRISLQKRLDEILQTKQDLESRLKDLEIASAETKASLKAKEDTLNGLAKQLDDEKTQNARSQAKIQEQGSEIERLKADLEEEAVEKESLLKRLEQLNEDYLNLKFQLENLSRAKGETEKDAKKPFDKESISLGTVVIKR
jgi:chromosome segregation ATPase